MPEIIRDSCIACGICTDVCPADAITITDVAVIDTSKCTECGACAEECGCDAVRI